MPRPRTSPRPKIAQISDRPTTESKYRLTRIDFEDPLTAESAYNCICELYHLRWNKGLSGMSTHSEIDHLAKEERIRAIAYSLWEGEGCPDDRAEEHWLKACDLVEAEAMPRPELAAAEAIPDPDWLKRDAAVEKPAVAEKPSRGT